MKKKLIVKETGKSIEIGDTLEDHFHFKKDGTEVIGISRVKVTDQNVKDLIKKGILTVQTFEGNTSYKDIPTDLSYYLDNFVKSITYDSIEAYSVRMLLNVIGTHCPHILFIIVLRQIAITLDHRYEGDIKDSDDIYAISTSNGSIFRVPKETIKNYRNFAAFRSEEDAKFAKQICKDLLNVMYGWKK